MSPNKDLLLQVETRYCSEHGSFKILVSSKLGVSDYAEISLTEDTKEKMKYFCPLPDVFRINLPRKSILTEQERGNKKHGKVSLLKLQKKFLYNHHEIDTKGIADSVNYSLSIMRNSPFYHRRYS
jgi:hypothetical protein